MAGTRVGHVLASKYRLEELLGSGGMGHVYRATNVRAGRAVAIKILRTEHATNTPIVDRFLREALAANLVRHPNVVDVLDVDKDEDGAPFIVQELLMGEDLAKYVERRGGRLNLREIEDYLVPVIDAVAEAHAQGVVHRDIKPENVFLATQTGPGGAKKIPKLLDFGISKVRLPDVKATEVGVLMGTPAYMAPEQVQGSRDADPRTDVWALGIMLFEVLSGRLPYDAVDAPALFVAIATRDAERLIEVVPTIDPHVSRVVERCLRRNADQRYPSAAELARDMRHVLEGADIEPTLTRSVPPAALRGGPALDVPDLALPPLKMTAEPFELKKKPPPAANTIRDAPAHFADTEYQNTRQHTAPMDVPDLAPAPKAPPPPSARGLTAPLASQPAPVPALPAPSPPSQPAVAPPSSRVARDQAMPGVMLAGSSTSTQRRAPYPQPQARPPAQDMSFVVGLAVVGLVGLGTTAVLSGVFPQPGGFALLPFVMKPVPSGANLAVQLVLAALGLFVAGKLASGGVKRWNEEMPGGRGGAIFFAVVAGAFLFGAVQLGRAAW